MENNNNNGTISEVLSYLGGKIAFLITAGIVTFVFLASGIYVSAVVRPREAKLKLEREIAASEAEASRQIEESIRQSEEEALAAEFDGTGIYVGNTGSVLILYDNGFADYYHEAVGLNKSNVWTYVDGKLDITILCLLSEVEATYNSEDPTHFSFVSESVFWDNEEFTYISADPQEMTETELADLVSEYNQ